MNIIDLGEEEHITIKKGAEEYKISAPSVFQIELFQETMKNADREKQLGITREFFAKLGLPIEVSKGLTIIQFNKLVEGMLGRLKKK